MRRSIGVTAAVLTLASALAARADFGDFTYTTQLTPDSALPDASATGAPATILDFAGVGPARFDAAPPGGTDIQVGTVAVVGLGLGLGDFADRYDAAFAVTITITDLTTGRSGALSFAGRQAGLVTGSARGVGSIRFENPGFGPVQRLALGTTVYTVAAVATKDFTPPGLPQLLTAGEPGTYGFTVRATGPTAVPTPSSLALLAVGGPAVAWARRRATGGGRAGDAAA
jgi:hypothetical protein